MAETDIEAELSTFQDAIHQLHEDLNYIRLLVATADAATRKIYQGLELMLQHLKDTAEDSPEAPVTPTCPSVPWNDFTTDEDKENTKNGVDGETMAVD